MAYPLGIVSRTVTGTYNDLYFDKVTGDYQTRPKQGFVYIYPSASEIRVGSVLIDLEEVNPLRVAIDETGTFSFEAIVTDQDGISPNNGWTYRLVTSWGEQVANIPVTEDLPSTINVADYFDTVAVPGVIITKGDTGRGITSVTSAGNIATVHYDDGTTSTFELPIGDGSGGDTPDATATIKGKLRLTNALTGTADSPAIAADYVASSMMTPAVRTSLGKADSAVQPAGLTKAAVGLGNVDNTADVNKPVSNATQTALNLKANISNLNLVAFTGAYSDLSGKPTIPSTKADVGLGNVDNTSDANKPVSSATQTALDGKANVVHTHPEYIKTVNGVTPDVDGAVDVVADWTDITSKPTTFPPSTHTHDYSTLTGIPSEFTPSAHTHTIANVTGLQTALDGKANTVHTHLWADITDKPTTFTPSAHTHSVDDLSDASTIGKSIVEAADAPAVRTIIGAGTSNLTLGTTGTTAAAGNHTHAYSSLTGIPTTFAPSAHTHAVTDVTGLQDDLDGKADLVHTHAISDVTGLDAALAGKANASALDTKADLVSGKIPTSQLPGSALIHAQFVNNTGEMLALTINDVQNGDIVRIIGGPSYYTLVDDTDIDNPDSWVFSPGTSSGGSETVTTVNGQVGDVVLGKADVGLGNVNNTSDANKPISTATQTALDGKSDVGHTHTDADISNATTIGRTVLTSVDAAAVRTAIGAGTGNSNLTIGTTSTTAKAGNYIPDWTEITSIPATFPPSTHTHTPAEVGLGNVDNTSDANKPISTATQTALNAKASLTGVETLTNKTVTDATFFMQDDADNTKKAQFQLSGITTGTTRTITIPNFSGTMYVTGGTDVSVADGGTGRSTSTTAYGLIAAGTTATGAQQTIAPGTAGQFLKSAGAAALGAFASIVATDISDSTSTGRSVLTAVDGPAVRTLIGAGTSSLTIGTTNTTAKAGDYVPAWTEITSKPTTFAPSAHTHPISDITGLQTALDGKEPVITAGTTGQFWRGDKTFVAIDKTTVGLSNVDNTSDTTKFTNTALTGTPTAPTAAGGTNTTQIATTAFVTAGLAGKANTSHTHAIADVTGLQTALDLKAPLDSPAFTGTVTGVTKGMVGLGSVDNTSDASKPISTATQTALDGKQPLDSDLTAIAALTPTNDDIIQRKAGAWTNRTMAQLKTDLGISGTNTGDQTITLTGEVTGSGTGSFATTVANSAVIGKVLTGFTSGAGAVAATDTILQAIQKLNGNDALKAPLSHTHNVADINATGTPSATTYLRGDGTWATVSGGSSAWVDITGKPADLTTIAGLSPANDDFLQRKAGAWANRTIAQVKTDLGLSGTNTGDQTITLTGEVTGSGTGSFATTVGNAAVIGKVLTGFTSGAGTVAATDTILQAIQKLNGNDGLKAPLASPTFTGTVSGITSTMVGLGNVDNTSDVNKPVSTATQTALDLKANKAGSVSGTGLPWASEIIVNGSAALANGFNDIPGGVMVDRDIILESMVFRIADPSATIQGTGSVDITWSYGSQTTTTPTTITTTTTLTNGMHDIWVVLSPAQSIPVNNCLRASITLQGSASVATPCHIQWRGRYA